MTTKWKPTPAQMAALRAYVLKYEREHVSTEAGERYNVEDASVESAVNILRVTSHPDWDDTDLNTTHSLDSVRRFKLIDLTEGGEALVDWYCYNRRHERELVTNVQSHVRLVDGVPKLWKITGTLTPDLILDTPI